MQPIDHDTAKQAVSDKLQDSWQTYGIHRMSMPMLQRPIQSWRVISTSMGDLLEQFREEDPDIDALTAETGIEARANAKKSEGMGSDELICNTLDQRSYFRKSCRTVGRPMASTHMSMPPQRSAAQ